MGEGENRSPLHLSTLLTGMHKHRGGAREAITRARSDGKHRFLHAFPSVDNHPSNAICQKLGFILIEECEFEYPRGSFMRCNDWRLDLSLGS